MVVPARIELATHGFSVHCSTNWATEPTHGCEGRIWTYGLQVMSLTSYRAALPRDVWRRSWDSNPGAACTTYRFSRPDPSATWVLLHFEWWTLKDSNLWPPGYEPEALTNWAKGPNNGSEGGTRTHDLPGMNRSL